MSFCCPQFSFWILVLDSTKLQTYYYVCGLGHYSKTQFPYLLKKKRIILHD